jgi:hypothetical protein
MGRAHDSTNQNRPTRAEPSYRTRQASPAAGFRQKDALENRLGYIQSRTVIALMFEFGPPRLRTVTSPRAVA